MVAVRWHVYDVAERRRKQETNVQARFLEGVRDAQLLLDVFVFAQQLIIRVLGRLFLVRCHGALSAHWKL